ncbi:unnamed protein product [Caenorhabditis auriculariae]|uniref:Autophagy-related protein 2 n=1 Tax=Caenorhabditis auriculariae TaxID=2777116 RepID=A0A8S1HMJ5_9PELO|nr:unnamed protein product [Caenorhabditis auriculariae]
MIPERMRKMCAQHLIHRFFGKFLENQIPLDRLSLNLTKGHVEVEEINLHVEYFNEILTKMNVPFVLVDGYIGKFRAEVPWLSLMSNSTRIRVEDLQLTFQAREKIKIEDKEKVAAMVGKIVEKLTVPPESIFEDSSQENVDPDEGIEAFVKVIDSIYTRFRADFAKTIIRVETLPAEESGICQALEFRIEEIKFMDEKLRAALESIKIQPPKQDDWEMNKFFAVNGLTIFTDVYSPLANVIVRQDGSEISTSINDFHSCRASMSSSFQNEPRDVSESELYSNPIKFAQTVGETKFSFRSKPLAETEQKVKIDTLFEGFQVFITPSQLSIVKKFVELAAFSEQEKLQENEEIVIRNDGNAAGSSEGNLQKEENFKTIDLNDFGPPENDADKSFSLCMSENFKLKLTFATFLAYIPHHDFLSLENVSKERNYHLAISEFEKEAEKFFALSEVFEFSPDVSLDSVRAEADKLYLKDHLRIFASSAHFSYSLYGAYSSECWNIWTEICLTKCDFLEYLTEASVPTSNGPTHVPLLNFSDPGNNPNLKIIASTSAEAEGKFTIEALISSCETELDLSILDRISDFIVPRPFFDKKCIGRSHPQSSILTTADIDIVCPDWKLNLRVPKANDHHHQRLVHPESLKFNLKGVKARFSKNDSISLDFSCNEVKGDFISPEMTETEESHLFYATSSKLRKIGIKVEYDPRNKCLGNETSEINLPTCEMSLSAPVLAARKKREGPFSQISRVFNDEEIIEAGDRKEMLEFQANCIKMSTFTVRFDVPLLRIRLPEKKNLELIYNRLLNDLALWKPAAPALRIPENDVKINALNSIQASSSRENDIDVSEDVEDEEEEKEDFDRNRNHNFCLTLNIHKGTVLCETVVRENTQQVGNGQVALDFQGAHLGTTFGYHGAENHTFFHFTTRKTSIGSSNRPDAMKRTLEAKDFGKWTREETQAEFVEANDELSVGSTKDSLGIALHSHFKPDSNVKDVLLAVALRNTLFHARHFEDVGQFWAAQLVEFFTLEHHPVPETPLITPDLRFDLENVVLGYDHVWVNPDSDARLRLVLGDCNFSSSLVREKSVSKTLCVFENSSLLLSNESPRKLARLDDFKNKKDFLKVLDVGLMQLEVMISMTKDEKIPLFEIKCSNDIVQMWACADSLALLVNVLSEMSEVYKFRTTPPKKENEQITRESSCEPQVEEQEELPPLVFFDLRAESLLF